MTPTDIPEERLLEMMKSDPPRPERIRPGAPRALSLLTLLQAAAVVLLCALAVEFIFPRFSFFASADSKVKQDKPWQGISAKTEALPQEAYVQEVSRVNIFGPAFSDAAELMLDGVTDLVLAGIVFEDPAQAILKNTKSGSLLYLKAGESASGVKVLQIEEGRIVVEYQGESFEMRL